MIGIVQTIHPTSDQLYDLLTREEWEGLAVFSSEGIITELPDTGTKTRLVRLGLIGAGERPTAAGYALLLSWLRRNPKRSFAQMYIKSLCHDFLSILSGKGISNELDHNAIHCNRMRLLLLGGAKFNAADWNTRQGTSDADISY